MMKLVAFFLILCCAWVYGHRCIHDELMAEGRKRGELANYEFAQNYTTPTGDNPYPTANNTRPIRIKLDLRYLDNDSGYTCYNSGQQVYRTDGSSGSTLIFCSEADVLSAAGRAYLNNTLLPQAKARLEAAFSVVPVAGRLILPSPTMLGNCGKAGVTMPASYNNPGVDDADLVVFVTTRPASSDVLAYALACVDDQNKRAIAGLININPSGLSTNIGELRAQRSTVEHELTHVLGLSDSKYNQFRNSNTSSSSKYVTATTTVGDTTYITTPEVKSFIQSHFGCPTLFGAQLEDGGGGGTAASHWEKSVYMNEYMTGSSVRNPELSKLTLSYFRDSGWYYTNYDQADPFVWGYQKGCDFADKPCPSGWPSGNGYSCSAGSTTPTCTFDLQGKGVCSTDSLTGSTCNYIRGYSDGWCIDVTASTPKNPILESGEEFGDNSRCFSSSLWKNSPSGVSNQPICYNTACVSATSLKVHVEDWYYDCPAGGQVAVKDYGGFINCPDPTLICLGHSDDTAKWPVLSFVEPDKGEPGTTITITGRYLTGVNEVYIAGDCTKVNVVDDNTVVATLPTYEKIKNPSNFLKSKANIYMKNANGYNSFNHNRFNLQISLSKDLLKAAGKWLADHWYVPLIAGIVILALILLCVFCRRDNVKNREKRFARQQKAEMHQIEQRQKHQDQIQMMKSKSQYDQQHGFAHTGGYAGYDSQTPKPRYG